MSMPLPPWLRCRERRLLSTRNEISAALLCGITGFRDHLWLPAAHGTQGEIRVAPYSVAGRLSEWMIKNITSTPELFRMLSLLGDR